MAYNKETITDGMVITSTWGNKIENALDDHDKRLNGNITLTQTNISGNINNFTIKSSDNNISLLNSSITKYSNLEGIEIPNLYTPTINDGYPLTSNGSSAYKIFVDGTNGDDFTADGTSTKAYKTIYAAIKSLGTHVNRNITILIQPGTYYELVNIMGISGKGGITLYLANGVTIHGGIFISRCTTPIWIYGDISTKNNQIIESTGNSYCVRVHYCTHVYLGKFTIRGNYPSSPLYITSSRCIVGDVDILNNTGDNYSIIVEGASVCHISNVIGAKPPLIKEGSLVYFSLNRPNGTVGYTYATSLITNESGSTPTTASTVSTGALKTVHAPDTDILIYNYLSNGGTLINHPILIQGSIDGGNSPVKSKGILKYLSATASTFSGAGSIAAAKIFLKTLPIKGASNQTVSIYYHTNNFADTVNYDDVSGSFLGTFTLPNGGATSINLNDVNGFFNALKNKTFSGFYFYSDTYNCRLATGFSDIIFASRFTP